MSNREWLKNWLETSLAILSRYLKPGSFEARAKLGIALVSLAVWAIFLYNCLLPLINLQNESWEYPTFVPFIRPIGSDFREGYFYPAKVLLQGKSPYVDYNLIYPPFSALFSTPFRLFKVQTAYLVQVILLFVLNIATICVALRSAQVAFDDGEAGDSEYRLLFSSALLLQIGFLTITSYGFLFSVERGNFDIYAQFFSVLALWVLVKKHQQVWLETLLVSIATHLKIYPAILFILIFYRHRWKSLLPMVAVNLILYFITGPYNAFKYIEVITHYTANPFLWAGNHSAASFGSMVDEYLAKRLGWHVPVIAFTLLPILLWGIGAVALWRKKHTSTGAALLFILSVPLMNLLPSTSHDYKLVILSAPLAMLLYLLLRGYAESGNWIELAKILALMVLMLYVTRTYAITPAILTNKYPFILAFETITLLSILFPARFMHPSTLANLQP